MKFMRITGPKDTFMSLPAEERTALTAASFAFFDKYMKAGKCKDWYMLMDGRWAAAWDFDSVEDMVNVTMEEPMRLYINVESLPFMNWQETAKMRARVSAAAKAVAKK